MLKNLRAGATVAAITAALALTGCAGASDGAESSTAPSASAEVVGPVIAPLNQIDGRTVEVAVGNTIDLTGDDETYADWTAEVADESIVEFTPGGDEGGAQFNPGLEALAVGETSVTLENSATGDTVAFVVQVTEG